MNKRIACLLAAIALLFSYCKKDAEPEKVFLTVDKPDLSLFGLVGSAPTTFVIQSNAGWQITSSEDWLNTDKSSGSGETVVTVKASGTNITDTYRTATLTVTSTADT